MCLQGFVNYLSTKTVWRNADIGSQIMEKILEYADIVALTRNASCIRCGPCDSDSLMTAKMLADAREEIRNWPGYQPTELHRLDAFSDALGLKSIHYKDESTRFGLGSFKAVGGAYAVFAHVLGCLGKPTTQEEFSALRTGAYRDECADIVITSATDGNHGRSVAWGAQMIGTPCKIYLHRDVSMGREQALLDLGAEIMRVDGDYDESVKACARDAEAGGWHVVSDTSYEGYVDIPRQVMSGYGIIASEVMDVLRDDPPSHVFIPAGVGGLASALAMAFRNECGEQAPHIIVVESAYADCIGQSFRAGRPVDVTIEKETVMAGLSCGENSLIAIRILTDCANAAVSITDDAVAAAMCAMHDGTLGNGRSIEAGECAVAGLVALAGLMKRPDDAAKLGLDAQSNVLVIGTEGATDRAIYDAMLEAGRG